MQRGCESNNWSWQLVVAGADGEPLALRRQTRRCTGEFPQAAPVRRCRRAQAVDFRWL